jgi:glycosyltransferase involved in cell wall biosynthesis
VSFRLSVLTATRNRRALLERCIESVASQDHPDKEHVIVDGASSDGSQELLREAGARHPHIRWRSAPDRNLSHAFNRGLALVTGAAFDLLGDDDCLEPGALSAIASLYEQHPQAGVIAGGCHFVSNAGDVLFTQRASFTTRRDLLQCWRYWGNRICLPSASSFISMKAVEVVGGFSEADRFAMDYRHWIQVTEQFPVVTVDRVLARFRYDAGSVSHSPTPHQWEATLAISRQYWGSLLTPGYWGLALSYLWHYRRHRLRGRILGR